MQGLGKWAAAAALCAAIACGSSRDVSQAGAASPDQHEGPDAICAVCSAGADAFVTFAGTQMHFTMQAAGNVSLNPDGVTYSFQPGVGGVGGAVVGSMHLDPVSGGPGLSGTFDTVVACGRTNDILRGTFSGTMAGQRFTVELTDGYIVGLGPSTTVAFTAPSALGPAVVESGFLHIGNMVECHAPCMEGMCWCLDGRQCESCADANHGDIPTCLEGTCWDPPSATCAPCATVPPPSPPPISP